MIYYHLLVVIHPNKEFYNIHLFEFGRLVIGLNVGPIVVLELLSQVSQFLILVPNQPTANAVLQFERLMNRLDIQKIYPQLDHLIRYFILLILDFETFTL